MKIKVLFFFIFCTIGSLQRANANGYAELATVAEVAIGRSYGNFVFIRLSSPPTTPAACSNSSWHFTLSLDGVASKEMYAMLLSAQASGRSVRVAGTGSCSEYSAVESITTLNIVSD